MAPVEEKLGIVADTVAAEAVVVAVAGVGSSRFDLTQH